MKVCRRAVKKRIMEGNEKIWIIGAKHTVPPVENSS